MKHFAQILLSFFLSLFIISPVFAHENLVTFVNHYDRPISYTIGINPEMLPDLPVNFILQPNEQIQSSMINAGKEEAYIRGADGNGGSVFFGMELINEQIIFHGYISKAIAYSWKDKTLIFCTPEEYKIKKSCF